MRIINNKLRKAIIDWLIKDIIPPRHFPLSDFERLSYEIRPGDILLIEGRSRVARVIQMITQSNWSHAALYIGRIYDIADHDLRAIVQQHYQGEADAQLIIESIMGQGIIVSPLTTYQTEHIRICRPNGIARKDVQEVIAYAIKRIGFYYDVRQIIDLFRFLFPWAILPRRWRSTLFAQHAGASTKESCSSLLAEAFQAVDFPILPVLEHNKKDNNVELIQRNPRLFTPSDFDYSPFFDIIKYPIIRLGGAGTYHDLPWKIGSYSNDNGEVYTPAPATNLEEKKEQEQQIPDAPASNASKKKKTTKKQAIDSLD